MPLPTGAHIRLRRLLDHRDFLVRQQAGIAMLDPVVSGG